MAHSLEWDKPFVILLSAMPFFSPSFGFPLLRLRALRHCRLSRLRPRWLLYHSLLLLHLPLLRLHPLLRLPHLPLLRLHNSLRLLHLAFLLPGVPSGFQTFYTPTVLLLPMSALFPVAPVPLNLFLGHSLVVPLLPFPTSLPIIIPPT